jgi:hypothetical protein
MLASQKGSNAQTAPTYRKASKGWLFRKLLPEHECLKNLNNQNWYYLAHVKSLS